MEIHVQNPTLGPTRNSNFPKLFGLQPGCTLRVTFEAVNNLGWKRPKSNLDCFDETNNFYVELFLSEAILRGVSAVFRSLWQRNPKPGRTSPECPTILRETENPDGYPWSVRPSWCSRAYLAPTFAYDLGLRRCLYQNRPLQQYTQISCSNFFHPRPS